MRIKIFDGAAIASLINARDRVAKYFITESKIAYQPFFVREFALRPISYIIIAG